MARGLLVWCLIMLLETLHGVLRGLFLVPRLGEAATERIGWPVGAVLVMGVSLAAIPWTRLKGRAELLWLGVIWAVLTLAFEAVIGLLRGLDLAAIRTAFDPRHGLVLYSALLMLFAPLLARRLRG